MSRRSMTPRAGRWPLRRQGNLRFGAKKLPRIAPRRNKLAKSLRNVCLRRNWTTSFLIAADFFITEKPKLWRTLRARAV